MHAEARAWVAQQLATTGRVLEVGGFIVNGTIRDLFAAADYVGIDLRAGGGVDVIGDGADLPFGSVFDLVICCEVLEHAPRAAQLVREALRVLRPGGRFVMTCATHGRAPHGVMGGPVGGESYANIDPDVFAAWVDGHPTRLEVHRDRGDLYATVTR